MPSNDLIFKIRAFERKIIHIQKKYRQWFDSRPGTRFGHRTDRIVNHTFFHWSNNKPIFGFWHDSDLPDYIRTDCMDAFKGIFSNE